MTERRLVYSRKLRVRFRTLEEYIVERKSQAVAEAYIRRIQVRCQRLLLAPEQGTRQDQYRPGLRTTGFENRIVIAFRVTRTSVRILSIAYAGRRFQNDF